MLDKLQIRTRLLVSYAIIVTLMIITSVYALNRMDFAASRTTALYDHPFTVRKAVRDATLNFLKMRSKLKDAVTARDGSAVNADLRMITDAEKEFTGNIEIVKERYLGKKEDVDHVLKVFEEWKLVRDKIVAAIEANKK